MEAIVNPKIPLKITFIENVALIKLIKISFKNIRFVFPINNAFLRVLKLSFGNEFAIVAESLLMHQDLSRNVTVYQDGLATDKKPTVVYSIRDDISHGYSILG